MDGLPSDNVRRILFSRDGAVWFATSAGVARFDGRRFESFSRVDGLLDDDVSCIYETRDGAFWLLRSFSTAIIESAGRELPPKPECAVAGS